jgi:exodeoxyribonuclease VII large subunit
VITSPTGAVIRDILNITGRRFPSVHILISPVRVQGTEAPAEIIRAIDHFNSTNQVDVIILARGGGSLEDLAPFNDEGVARKIFASRLPIISAVGHETDFTIADFAADLRTPTPSAAAEMAVPIRRELASVVESCRLRLIQSQRRWVERRMERLLMLEDRLIDPVGIMNQWRIFLKESQERLKRVMSQALSLGNSRKSTLELQIRHASPMARLKTERLKIANERKDLIGAVMSAVKNLRSRVAVDMSVLDTLSPLANLKRGYSITKRLPDGLVIRAVDDIAIGTDIAVKVARGGFEAKVTQVHQE